MSHRIISIGYMGEQTVYVNLSREEAIQRYRKASPWESDEDFATMRILEFDIKSEFKAYDVWESEDKP